MDDDKEAKEFGIDDLPALVYFENKLPAIYDGKVFHYTKGNQNKECIIYILLKHHNRWLI